MISREIQKHIIRVCQRIDQKGWVANHDGNVTVRLPSGGFAATPTARAKGDLTEQDLIELDSAAKKVSGKGALFSEWAIHARVYSQRKDVNAVVHAHAPSSMAVGCANQEMITWAVPEAVVSLGPGIPLVGLCAPNSEALWTELDLVLPYYDAVLVGGNGVFTWGKDLEQAYLRLELVEHLAKIFLACLQLGGPKLLPFQLVEELLEKRKKAGLALPPDPARPHWFGS